MGHKAAMVAAIATGLCLCAAPVATAQVQPPDPASVPPRTAISVRTSVPGVRWGTANENEVRSGLSVAKLYLVDYALRHGDGSASDRELAERMIRSSDDMAADTMAAKYPGAVDAIAEEYHLTSTRGGEGWGAAATSTSDIADFLDMKIRTEPDSPILAWMADPAEKAADGTVQDWGTARLPSVVGTKWGWSDFGESEVASASYGPGFTVAAHTRGTSADQTTDVVDAVSQMISEVVTEHGAPIGPQIVLDLLARFGPPFVPVAPIPPNPFGPVVPNPFAPRPQ